MIGFLSDQLNILTKLTLNKFWNILKIFLSYHIASMLKRPIHCGMPFSVSIEPTTSCNLRCPECPSGLRSFTRPTGMLDLDTFKTIVGQMQKNLVYLTLYFQGEPYLNPHFFDFVKFASEKKIYTATSTNAHFLNDKNAEKTVKSGLDRLIISIDGATQNTYESYRVGGQLQKVIEGTKNLISWKKRLKTNKPFVIFQFLVVKPNEHEIPVIKNLGRSLSVNQVKFKTAQIYDFENGSPLIPDNEKYSRYKKMANGKYAIKNNLENHCWRMWHSAVITWEASVIPCCFDKDAQYAMGNLMKTPIAEIWNNEHYRHFRSGLLKGRKNIDICRNCTDGMKVWA